jgi:hypothetical protein
MKKLQNSPQIFISYAKEDKNKAEDIYNKLLKLNFKPWLDTNDILPGERWADSIQRAIRKSDFFLALFSNNSIEKRGFLQREFKQALDIWQEKLEDDIYFIPVRLEDCEVPIRFRDFQSVDLFSDGDLSKLVKAINTGYKYQNQIAKNFTAEESVSTNVEEQIKKNGGGNTSSQSHSRKSINILFLAANPSNTTLLMLDEEIRSIDKSLRLTEFRDDFNINQQWAVRASDLQEALLRFKPDIVHFSGHGSSASEIILNNRDGQSHPISSRALSRLFSILRDNIKCVVLNACYSASQAAAIAEQIDCVIGMSKTIGDDSAISFATAFYQALGYGKDIQTAFDAGCVEIDIEGLDEQDTPKLFCMRRNPGDITFIHTS